MGAAKDEPARRRLSRREWMEGIVSLAWEQLKAIEEEQWDRLPVVIARKEELIRRVESGGVDLGKPRWSLGDAGPGLQTLEGEYLRLERRCRELLSQEREEVKQRLLEVRKGKTAMNGYDPTPAHTPRFLDTKS